MTWQRFKTWLTNIFLHPPVHFEDNEVHWMKELSPEDLVQALQGVDFITIQTRDDYRLTKPVQRRGLLALVHHREYITDMELVLMPRGKVIGGGDFIESWSPITPRTIAWFNDRW